jgi:hypothetical protein
MPRLLTGDYYGGCQTRTPVIPVWNSDRHEVFCVFHLLVTALNWRTKIITWRVLHATYAESQKLSSAPSRFNRRSGCTLRSMLIDHLLYADCRLLPVIDWLRSPKIYSTDINWLQRSTGGGAKPADADSSRHPSTIDGIHCASPSDWTPMPVESKAFLEIRNHVRKAHTIH